ncbi:MAG: hypothetical protein J1F35_08745 [Erysipelotrichales bacterium]|nr:hypothetical protein [Erysipelotrichales bacterium]
MEDFQINKLNYDADKGWFIKNQPDLSVDEATKLSKKRLLIRLLKSLHKIEK